MKLYLYPPASNIFPTMHERALGQIAVDTLDADPVWLRGYSVTEVILMDGLTGTAVMEFATANAVLDVAVVADNAYRVFIPGETPTFAEAREALLANNFDSEVGEAVESDTATIEVPVADDPVIPPAPVLDLDKMTAKQMVRACFDMHREQSIELRNYAERHDADLAAIREVLVAQNNFIERIATTGQDHAKASLLLAEAMPQLRNLVENNHAETTRLHEKLVDGHQYIEAQFRQLEVNLSNKLEASDRVQHKILVEELEPLHARVSSVHTLVAAAPKQTSGPTNGMWWALIGLVLTSVAAGLLGLYN